MNTNSHTYSITDLRQKTKKVLDEVLEKSVVYLFRNSKPEIALVDINYLKSLEEAYEDYLDVIEFDKRKKETTISWDKYKKSKGRFYSLDLLQRN